MTTSEVPERTLRCVLRIIAGEYRSRPLVVPRGEDLTRPMGSRTREALFDLLRGWFDGTTVVDLFAGVGTLGLEAVSRGAARVVCVERDRFIARLLRENIGTFGCGDRVTVVEADALVESTLAALPRPVDLIFCDPPFSMVIESSRSATPEPRHERIRADEPGAVAEPRGRGRRRSARGLPDSTDEEGGLPPGTWPPLDADDGVRRLERDRARLDAMLARLRPLFGSSGFLALRLPEPRRGTAGVIAGFDGPEIHGYGDQQWVHLYAPTRVTGGAVTADSESPPAAEPEEQTRP